MVEYVAHSRDHVVLLGIGHAREKGQAYDTVGNEFGVREVAGLPAKGVTVIRIQMRRAIVQTCTDIALFERGHKIVASQRRTDARVYEGSKKMPGVPVRISGI